MFGGHEETAAHRTAVNWTLVVAVTLLVIDAGAWVLIVANGAWFVPAGADFSAYHEGAWRWLSGGSFYHPYQLAGPYGTAQVDEPLLYPPTIIPFLLLPAPLYWGIPIAIVLWRSRSPLALALILWPQTAGMVVVGNPGMWVVAMLALATKWPAFAPWVLMKPSLFPFALYRIHRRAWWLGLGVFCLVSLAFLPLWFDWLTALRNVKADALYSLTNLAPMLIPLRSAGWHAGRGSAPWSRRPSAPAWEMRSPGT